MANVFDVADFFIESASLQDDCLTNMKLNKLLYYAQAWSLAKYDRPLFDDPIEAWEYGPVVNNIYQKYKSHKKSPIREVTNEDYNDSLTSEEQDLLVDVMMNFGQFTAYTLANMTHAKGGPWAAARTDSQIISNNTIKDYFRSKHPDGLTTEVSLKYTETIFPKRSPEGTALLPREIYCDWE